MSKKYESGISLRLIKWGQKEITLTYDSYMLINWSQRQHENWTKFDDNEKSREKENL